MNCPYCNRFINAWTGLQELQKFQKHLPKCRKNPANVTLRDGRRSVIVPPGNRQNLNDALNIRHDSGQ